MVLLYLVSSRNSDLIKNLIKYGKLINKLTILDIIDDINMCSKMKIILIYILTDDENFIIRSSDTILLQKLNIIEDHPKLSTIICMEMKLELNNYIDSIRSL